MYGKDGEAYCYAEVYSAAHDMVAKTKDQIFIFMGSRTEREDEGGGKGRLREERDRGR